MTEMFERIFNEVMDEMNIDNRYKLYDSEDFETVEKRIAKELGVEDVYSIEEFCKWETDIYWGWFCKWEKEKYWGL